MEKERTKKERHGKGRGLRRKTWEGGRTKKGRHGKVRGLRREED